MPTRYQFRISQPSPDHWTSTLFPLAVFQHRVFDVPTWAVGVVVGLVTEAGGIRFRGNGDLHPLHPSLLPTKGSVRGSHRIPSEEPSTVPGIVSSSRLGFHAIPGVEGEGEGFGRLRQFPAAQGSCSDHFRSRRTGHLFFPRPSTGIALGGQAGPPGGAPDWWKRCPGWDGPGWSAGWRWSGFSGSPEGGTGEAGMTHGFRVGQGIHVPALVQLPAQSLVIPGKSGRSFSPSAHRRFLQNPLAAVFSVLQEHVAEHGQIFGGGEKKPSMARHPVEGPGTFRHPPRPRPAPVRSRSIFRRGDPGLQGCRRISSCGHAQRTGNVLFHVSIQGHPRQPLHERPQGDQVQVAVFISGPRFRLQGLTERRFCSRSSRLFPIW